MCTGFRQLLESELDKVKANETDNPTSSLNQQLHALYRASTAALKVNTGEEGKADAVLGQHAYARDLC
jgi:hypothetical protein